MPKPVTRREFLNLLGIAGGSAATLKAGAALGLLPDNPVRAMQLASAQGSQRVVILGAGLSGLMAAYELDRAGYDCTILEAAHRPGGRIFTVRSGDLIDELGNRQYCQFDDEPHLYFNAGAARIPSTHRNILRYCKELGVELEIFVNENKLAWYQDDRLLNGKPVRNIDYTTNARGFMAEVLAKSLLADELDQPFSEQEAESLLSIVRTFGDLNEDHLYTGSFRAGYAEGGFLEHGVQKDMIAFRDLLRAPNARSLLTANEGETGPILLQPVGGMDRIVAGFTRHVGERIRYHAQVTAVQVEPDGVTVSYESGGERQQVRADYCFNCIPTHLLTGIENNYPADYVRALKYVRRGDAYKAAFQSKTRFWEDEDIYGGITWLNSPIEQIWYPTNGIHKSKGVLLATYRYGDGMVFTNKPQAERIEDALAQGEKVHADYRNQVEKPITIAWHRMNHMLGCSARWRRSAGGWTADEETMYHTLQAPVLGRHYMIGDQVTMHSAWQESAILSAQWALDDMDRRERERRV